MTELTQDLSLAQARSLIDSYAFDLGSDDAEKLLQYWLKIYDANWIRLATIEALYLGRYKAISIEHILNVWLRLGNPNIHFTYEFERLICRKLPKHLSNLSVEPDKEPKKTEIELKSFNSQPTQSIPVKLTKPLENDKLTINIVDTDTLNLEKVFESVDNRVESNLPLISTIALPVKADWSDFTMGGRIIHQFIPLPDVSSFFIKLKTFGQERLEGQ